MKEIELELNNFASMGCALNAINLFLLAKV
jgi:hypothetical protein